MKDFEMTTDNTKMPDVIYVSNDGHGGLAASAKDDLDGGEGWGVKYIRAPSPQVTDAVVKEAVEVMTDHINDVHLIMGKSTADYIKTLIQAALRPSQSVTVQRDVIERVKLLEEQSLLNHNLTEDNSILEAFHNGANEAYKTVLALLSPTDGNGGG